MANDLWRTPKPVFNSHNEEFNFIADMASGIRNKLVNLFVTEDQDALSLNWLSYVSTWRDVLFNKKSKGRYVWCNPPYSAPLPWIKKAIEAQKDGLGVVMLLNADHSVEWFSEALKGVSEIRFIVGDETGSKTGKFSSGRLAFLDGDGKPARGNNKAQFILVFNPFKICKNNPVTTYVNRNSFYK